MVLLLASAGWCPAQLTNSASSPLLAPALPDAGLSIFRVMGALALVLGLFLGGVWLYRNWQRLALQRGRAPQLNIIETRTLGGRNAIFVVGYEQERFLIAASPAGVNLLSHLPAAATTALPPEESSAANAPSFAQALRRVLNGK